MSSNGERHENPPPRGSPSWAAARDSGHIEFIVGLFLDLKQQQTQSSQWQYALIKTPAIIRELGKDPHPRARAIIDTVKHQFPPVIASCSHPLFCLGQNYAVGLALMQVLALLALMAQEDEKMLATLLELSFPYIAVITWFSYGPPPGDSMPFTVTTSSCNDVLNVLDDGEEPGIERAVAEFGTQSAAELICASFKRPQMPIMLFTHLCSLAHRMADTIPELALQLIHNRTTVQVAKLHWDMLVNSEEYDDISDLHTQTLGSIVELLSSHEIPESVALTVELIKTCDFVSLTAAGLYAFAITTPEWAATPAKTIARRTAKMIAEACRLEADMVDTHFRPHLLPVMNHLRDLREDEAPDRAKAIQTWGEIIQIVSGTTEADLRKAELEEGNVVPDGLIGCSWYQCIFHGGETDGAVKMTMLLDNRCRKVQYCSRYCQTKDWRDANHKGECSRLISQHHFIRKPTSHRLKIR